MTPEAQRMAIAEACGITEIHREVPEGRTVEFWTGMRGDNFRNVCVPDYPNDLNAMQEACATLSNADKEMFIHHLMGVYRGQASAAYGVAFSDPFTSLWMGTFATAAHRAEAFLRAIGKWVD